MKTIAQMVKADIEGAMGLLHERDIPLKISFGEVIKKESQNTQMAVEFHGTTLMNCGFAMYQGRFGKWMIKLAPCKGGLANLGELPCTRTVGAPVEIQ